MNDIADRDQVKTASQLRNMLSIYEQNQDLISIGAYKRGTNPVLDNAISHIDRINDFLQQAVGDKVVFQDTVAQMKAILN